MGTHVIQEETELSGIARGILETLSRKEYANIITLKGDLGAGKTALTKAIAKELGVIENVTSPTFVIMKSYSVLNHPFIQKLVHIDAYRIEDEDELRVLGFKELCDDPHALVCIEWPERIPKALPKGVHEVSIGIGGGGERNITYGI